jgi:esterase/lipase
MIASRLIVDSFISISGAGEDYLTLIQRQLSIQPAYVKSMSDPIIEKLKNKELVDSVPPLINSLFNNTIQKFLIDASSYDPKDEISKLDIPVLIVQGSNDIQIEIKDAQLLHNAAIKSRLEIIQGMNHVFRQSPENRLLNMQTYGNPELPIDASLVNLIVDFLDED